MIIGYIFIVWQILREIKGGESRNSKSASLTHLEALNFDFYKNLHFPKAEIYQINQIQGLENGKKGTSRTSKFWKIDFT